VTVELRTRRRAMRRDGSNHDEKLGLREFRVRVNWTSPIRQVWVPIWHVITPIRGLHNPIRQLVPLISRIRSYPPHGSHLHPPSLSFSSTTQSSPQNPKLCHPSLFLHAMIMSWHRVQHSPSTTFTEYSIHQGHHTQGPAYTEYSIHRVQHTPSTAYTEYSIHRVQAYTEYSIHRAQHTLSTASTQDCLSSLHSHDYKLTPKCSCSFWRGSLHDRPPSASSPWELKGKVTLSHCQVCESTYWWIDSQHPARRPSSACKYSSNVARSHPPQRISKLAR